MNVRGMFLGIKHGAAAMATAGGGSTVNLSSVLAVTADPTLGAYSATKGAVRNLTRAAALTYVRQGIRVNAVSHGAVATPLTTRVWDLADDPAQARRAMESLYPLGRIIEPEEVAASVAFLASADASGITGTSLFVVGGLTAANPEYALVKDLLK